MRISLIAFLLALSPFLAPATVRGDDAAERLATMKEAVRGYTFAAEGRSQPAFRLQAEPAFRLGRQGNGGILEGAIFLWTDAADRPEAAVQVFLHRYAGRPSGEWHHEFTSLATAPFEMAREGRAVWRPSTAGLVFRPLTGAPAPAASASQRLRQMRGLAVEFHAEDNFGDRGWEVLRLLPTPIARYGKPEATAADGALFAFVEGTDPEVFLFLEARPGGGGLEWQFAAAPMSCFALRLERKGQLAWSVPRRVTDDPTKPFFDRMYEP